jgi:signal transduction histidine kinase
MRPATLLRSYDERRLRNLLLLLFLALAIPTGAVVWQAWGQLKWEAWYQYRNQAEELTDRVDRELGQRVTNAEARAFADFSFLNAAPNGSIVQRSPLSVLPVFQDLPGVIGHFQVSPDGRLSTPLLPDGFITPSAAGLSEDDYQQRESLANNIRRILADNQLVSDRGPPAERSNRAVETGEMVLTAARRQVESESESEAEVDKLALPSAADAPAPAAEAQPQTPATGAPSPTQQGFDRLNQDTAADAASSLQERAQSAAGGTGGRASSLGRVQDLQLDEALQKKSEDLDMADQVRERKDSPASDAARKRRFEEFTAGPAPAAATNEVGPITAFESEIDPYQFSLLDSGHLVLFRNVWRNGGRYIQGLLLDADIFSEAVIGSAFQATALFEISNLVIGYNDDIMRIFDGGSYQAAIGTASELDGSLLYRSRLSAPFNSLELIFAVQQMPRGPGAAVLAWTTIVIAVVFIIGFLALYRLGLGQIRLARQQQDFVSAVSHELKTPLTSIRMYGEMLKEGWTDDAKRNQYYEYIHAEAERLTRLISNVLQLASITRSEPQLNLQKTRVSGIMDQIRSKISAQVAQAGFELELAEDESCTGQSITVDVDCFVQIIINLVDNAIKFARKSGEKRIVIRSAVKAGGRVVFSVRDFGPGIPKDQLKKIFKMFYRSESELTRETVGTGIGLAIVHQLATAMKGDVDVVNRTPGAEFRVTFPC